MCPGIILAWLREKDVSRWLLCEIVKIAYPHTQKGGFGLKHSNILAFSLGFS